MTEDRSRTGTNVRRRVLGDEHVDATAAHTTAFDAPFQEYITDAVWGSLWTRQGLDLQNRSRITLALLAALGHHDELAMHVRAAVRLGIGEDEIAEVLLHTAAYAGVPTANKAFKIAKETLAEL